MTLTNHIDNLPQEMACKVISSSATRESLFYVSKAWNGRVLSVIQDEIQGYLNEISLFLTASVSENSKEIGLRVKALQVGPTNSLCVDHVLHPIRELLKNLDIGDLYRLVDCVANSKFLIRQSITYKLAEIRYFAAVEELAYYKCFNKLSYLLEQLPCYSVVAFKQCLVLNNHRKAFSLVKFSDNSESDIKSIIISCINSNDFNQANVCANALPAEHPIEMLLLWMLGSFSKKAPGRSFLVEVISVLSEEKLDAAYQILTRNRNPEFNKLLLDLFPYFEKQILNAQSDSHFKAVQLLIDSPHFLTTLQHFFSRLKDQVYEYFYISVFKDITEPMREHFRNGFLHGPLRDLNVRFDSLNAREICQEYKKAYEAIKFKLKNFQHHPKSIFAYKAYHSLSYLIPNDLVLAWFEGLKNHFDNCLQEFTQFLESNNVDQLVIKKLRNIETQWIITESPLFSLYSLETLMRIISILKLVDLSAITVPASEVFIDHIFDLVKENQPRPALTAAYDLT